MKVELDQFSGPLAERNFKIVQEWQLYSHPVGRNTKSEGSAYAIGPRHGVSGRTVLGVVWRWRRRVKQMYPNATVLTCEPYAPRVSY